jgi:tripartite-type tricarboxylate transporter receptor subunit TctC
MRKLHIFLAVLAPVIVHCSWAAAATFPDRTVTIVVPYSAGGGIDTISRMLAEQMRERLGQPVVIENRAGAGGTLASTHVARAARDGYTLLMGSDGQLAIQPALRKTLLYNPTKDFVPVAIAGITPFALLVNANVPAQSVADLVKLAKEKPGELAYGSSGVGGTPHLVMEAFMIASGTKFKHVPYKGTSRALNDVIAGRVPVIFAGLTSVPGLLKAGKLRALGVSSKTRMKLLPTVPAIAEAGVPGFDATGVVTLVAPTGAPPEAVAKVHSALNAALATDQIRKRYESIGYINQPSPPPAALQKILDDRLHYWAKVVDKAGLTHSQ